MDDFGRRFKSLLEKAGLGNKYSGPSEMVQQWDKIVTNLEESGYDDFLVEYDNDLAIRGHIEKILRSWEPVNDMRSAFENFQIEIDRIDKRLKALFIDEKRTHIDKWWLAGILKNGSGDYANDIKSDCGIVLSA